MSLGTYRLLGVLGSGGMGRVYLGRSEAGRLVAVKTLLDSGEVGETDRARFRREVLLAQRVVSLATVPLVDADTEADRPWFATEYVPAPSLWELVRDGGTLPGSSVRWVAAGVSEALLDLHRAGVVHRDVKPQNILLPTHGPKLIDFGISHAADLTRTRATLGTLAFVSPEQARGEPSAAASDVFSLGATLFHLAVGRPPYPETESDHQLLRMVGDARIDLTGLPRELADLIRPCLAADPEQRPTPATVLSKFTASLEGLPTGGTVSRWLSPRWTSIIESYERHGRELRSGRTAPGAGTGANPAGGEAPTRNVPPPAPTRVSAQEHARRQEEEREAREAREREAREREAREREAREREARERVEREREARERVGREREAQARTAVEARVAAERARREAEAAREIRGRQDRQRRENERIRLEREEREQRERAARSTAGPGAGARTGAGAPPGAGARNPTTPTPAPAPSPSPAPASVSASRKKSSVGGWLVLAALLFTAFVWQPWDSGPASGGGTSGSTPGPAPGSDHSASGVTDPAPSSTFTVPDPDFLAFTATDPGDCLSTYADGRGGWSDPTPARVSCDSGEAILKVTDRLDGTASDCPGASGQGYWSYSSGSDSVVLCLDRIIREGDCFLAEDGGDGPGTADFLTRWDCGSDTVPQGYAYVVRIDGYYDSPGKTVPQGYCGTGRYWIWEVDAGKSVVCGQVA